MKVLHVNHQEPHREALVKTWEPKVGFDKDPLDQIRNTAMMPFIHKHVAVMRDVHWAFSITLNERWRVADDSRQWIIQRRRGSAGPKSLGWEPMRFHLSRDHVLEWTRGNISDLDHVAEAAIASLPERHP